MPHLSHRELTPDEIAQIDAASRGMSYSDLFDLVESGEFWGDSPRTASVLARILPDLVALTGAPELFGMDWSTLFALHGLPDRHPRAQALVDAWWAHIRVVHQFESDARAAARGRRARPGLPSDHGDSSP